MQQNKTKENEHRYLQMRLFCSLPNLCSLAALLKEQKILEGKKNPIKLNWPKSPKI